MNPFETESMINDIKSKYRILRSYDGLSFKVQKRDNYYNWFNLGVYYTLEKAVDQRDALIRNAINEIEESWTLVE